MRIKGLIITFMVIIIGLLLSLGTYKIVNIIYNKNYDTNEITSKINKKEIKGIFITVNNSATYIKNPDTIDSIYKTLNSLEITDYNDYNSNNNEILISIIYKNNTSKVLVIKNGEIEINKKHYPISNYIETYLFFTRF